MIPGYEGADCSVTVGEPPRLFSLLPGNTCDIRKRPCQKVRLHVSGIVTSDDLMCQVKRKKVNRLIMADAFS